MASPAFRPHVPESVAVVALPLDVRHVAYRDAAFSCFLFVPGDEASAIYAPILVALEALPAQCGQIVAV